MNRLKKEPVDYQAIIAKGDKYTDYTFERSQQYFALPHSGWNEFLDYWLFGWALYDWRRLGDAYPDATLFGNGLDFDDVEQGYGGTCYILAAMNALSEFDDILKGIFLTQEKNSAGIYALKMYVRGKPWIVTVDDEFMFYDGKPNFASTGDKNALWGPIMEKAFAKIKGSYAAANGGYTATGIRALTGVPTFDYVWS